MVAVTPAAAFVATYTATLAATNDVPPNATGSLVANIVADPAGFSFNVHTQAFPAGALRGQLVLGPAPPPPPPPPAEVLVVIRPAFTG